MSIDDGSSNKVIIFNLIGTASSHVRLAKMLCTFLSFYGIFEIDGTDDVHKY